MKLLSGERPSLRNWLGFWVVGFVSVCLLGTVLSVALWGIGQGAKALGPPYPAIVEFSLTTALRTVPLVGGGFGVILASAMMSHFGRDARIRRDSAVRIPGRHPLVGDFEYAPYFKSWTAHPVLPDGTTVTLWGKGHEPSETQSLFWARFVARADELLLLATADLLGQEHGYQGCDSIKFTPANIQLCSDGDMEILFEVTTVPEDFTPADYFENRDRGYGEESPTAYFTPKLELDRTVW